MIPHVAVQIHGDFLRRGSNWTWLEGHPQGARTPTLYGRFWITHRFIQRRWGGNL